jgi:hypothetical protein
MDITPAKALPWKAEEFMVWSDTGIGGGDVTIGDRYIARYIDTSTLASEAVKKAKRIAIISLRATADEIEASLDER